MRNVALNVVLMMIMNKMHGMYNIKVQQKRFEACHVVTTDCVKLNDTASEFF